MARLNVNMPVTGGLMYKVCYKLIVIFVLLMTLSCSNNEHQSKTSKKSTKYKKEVKYNPYADSVIQWSEYDLTPNIVGFLYKKFSRPDTTIWDLVISREKYLFTIGAYSDYKPKTDSCAVRLIYYTEEDVRYELYFVKKDNGELTPIGFLAYNPNLWLLDY